MECQGAEREGLENAGGGRSAQRPARAWLLGFGRRITLGPQEEKVGSLGSENDGAHRAKMAKDQL